jgi:hypothetical protein
VSGASLLAMRRAWLLLVCVAAGTLGVATGQAQAQLTTRKALWGPAEVGGVSQFPTYAELGAGIWETSLSWIDVAARRPAKPTDPADPAYAWPARLDAQIAEAARYGITVLVSVSGTPGWANHGRAWNYAPTEPQDYADYVAAASKRYPGVRRWLIWGEPSKAANFRPTGRKGAERYARILDASYRSLKQVKRSNIVIGGNTYTIGDVRPLTWIRELRLPSGKAPRMDYYGHNPFTKRTPRLNQPPLGHGYADFGDLDTLADALDRNLGRRPDGKRLPIFISELCFPTDHPNWEFNFHLTRATQAEWMADALKLTRTWPRLVTLGYLGLYDFPVRPAGDQVDSGLVTLAGVRKPAFDAFRRG